MEAIKVETLTRTEIEDALFTARPNPETYPLEYHAWRASVVALATAMMLEGSDLARFHRCCGDLTNP